MKDTNPRIRAQIDQFAANLEGLIREEAIKAVTDALGGKAPATNGLGKSHTLRGHALVAKVAAMKPERAGARAKGEKRSQEEIGKSADRAFSFIEKNPGSSMEQISRELGSSTYEMALPMRRLLEEKRVSKKGEKRGTKYFPKS